jgi:hypothetical protein
VKIKLYIVTYRRDDVLNQNLRTLWAGTRHPEWLEVTVISNHPEVQVEPGNLRPNLRVLINHTRHANSWGYLGRDWNFGIIDAFNTWKNPESVDWCVLAQNDVEWLPGWDTWLAGCKDLDLISQPVGDAVVALNIEAVRRVGLFDERFCTLHFHDIDYLNRAAVALKARASVNDCHFGEIAAWNPVGNVLIKTSATGFVDHDPTLHTRKSWLEMRNLLFHKWGFAEVEQAVNRGALVRHLRPQDLPRECLFYPFFWQGMASVLEQHIEAYSTAPPTLRQRLLSTYDHVVSVRACWWLRCALVSRLGLDDGHEKRRILREEEAKSNRSICDFDAFGATKHENA